MKIEVKVDEKFVIPAERFNDLEYIRNRVDMALLPEKGALKSILKYLCCKESKV